MSQRPALPHEFRFRDLFEDRAAHGEQLVAHESAFVAAMRERRPELFADDDRAEVSFEHAALPVTAPVDAPVATVQSPVFVVDAPDDLTVGFGGIAAPPSHDFPV